MKLKKRSLSQLHLTQVDPTQAPRRTLVRGSTARSACSTIGGGQGAASGVRCRRRLGRGSAGLPSRGAAGARGTIVEASGLAARATSRAPGCSCGGRWGSHTRVVRSRGVGPGTPSLGDGGAEPGGAGTGMQPGEGAGAPPPCRVLSAAIRSERNA